MIGLTSLQQILSMSHGPEKVQQVQLQQPDVQGRQFVADLREVVDIQKNQVQETEEGNQAHSVGDKREPGGKRQSGNRGKRRKAARELPPEADIHLEELNQGKIVDITI